MIGSPTHIRQILVNLLDNSIKYNKHGGTVTFSSTIKPVDDEHAVFCFSVSDTGIGMTPSFWHTFTSRLPRKATMRAASSKEPALACLSSNRSSI